MKKLILVLMFIGSMHAYAASDLTQKLIDADLAYSEGHFKEAEKKFYAITRSLADHNEANGHLLFNLGNSAFRNGKLGRALLHYEQARTLIPRDADIKANIEIVRKALKLPSQDLYGLWGSVFFWVHALTLAESVMLTLLCFCFSCVFYIVCQHKQSSWIRWAWIVSASMFLIFISAAIIQATTLHRSEAIVTVGETDLRSGRGDSFATLTKIKRGESLQLLEETDEWIKVELSHGKNARGWIRRSHALPIGRWQLATGTNIKSLFLKEKSS